MTGLASGDLGVLTLGRARSALCAPGSAPPRFAKQASGLARQLSDNQYVPELPVVPILPVLKNLLKDTQ